MSSATEHLFNAAMTLPNQDRLDLAEALLNSVDPTDRPPLQEEWRSIIRHRSAELDSGAVTPIAWEEVERRLDVGEKAGG